MRHVFPAALLSAACLAPFHAVAAEIHVSPQGSDTAGDGSAQKPFASLAKARDAARTAKDDADTTVVLHDGLYRLTQPLRLDARDSGKNGRKMIYAAAPGAHPVLSGARAVAGWTPAGGGIFKAQAGKESFRQLFVDGHWAQRARGPYFKILGSSPDAGTLSIPAKDWPSAFAAGAPTGLELAVHVHWRHLVAHCAASHPAGEAVTVVLPEEEKKRGFKPQAPFHGCTTHLENALALLDAPGEWYHDLADGTLSFMPEKSREIAQAQIEAPLLETLIEVKGTDQDPVHDLEFRGLTLTGTGWAKPSASGLHASQFAQPYGDAAGIPGALMASHTLRFAFRDGAVVCAGANGIILDDAKKADIANSTFRNIGCNALEGRHAILDAAIWNNDLSFCGRDISNGGGLLLRNPTRGARIEHNHLHDMPYSGMQVGDQPGGYRDTGTRGNKIRFNHVHHCMGLHDDGGGIYTLGGKQTDSEIAFNFIHDIRRGPWAGPWPVDGVYLDNDTQYIHVHHNVIRECTTAAKEQNRSKDNKLENNPAHDAAIEKDAGVKAGFVPERE